MNEEIAKELVVQAAGKTYDDLAHPTIQATGQIASFIPRTVRVWLGKWEKWILNGEYSIKETELILAEKLKNIPEENLIEPEPYVFVPALQQLSYSLDSEELRELYANLLASSMNVETKNDVHPAFVDIIKQLTPDEAKLLKYLSSQTVIPFVEVRRRSPDGKGYTVLAKYHINVPVDILEIPKNLAMYIENLLRLKFIDIPADAHYVDETLYMQLESNVIVSDGLKELIAYDRKIINVTSFGKSFARICQQ